MSTMTKMLPALAIATAAFVLPACAGGTEPTSPEPTLTRAAPRVAETPTVEPPAEPKTPREALDALVRNTVIDGIDYWAGKKVELPLEVRTPDHSQACQRPDAFSPAWLCTDYAVVYDPDKMLPLTTMPTTGVAVVLIIAHEIGHAAQMRINPEFDTSSPLGEQGASCTSGAYLRSLVDGTSGLPRITLETAQAAIEEAYPTGGMPGMSAADTEIARKQLDGGLSDGKPCIVTHGSKP